MIIPHIPCEEAAINVEKSLWRKLNFVDWIKTRWHMYLCKRCRDYEKDSKILHRILCSLKSKNHTERLNTEEKEKLKKSLK
jgi:hypothetical protein